MSRAAICLSIAAFIILQAIALAGTYGGGEGTDESPYLICDANQMQEIGANPGDWDKHFKLMRDIDLRKYTGTEFNIIGLNSTAAFRGVFDGNGCVVSGFSYATSGRDYIGLFGYAVGGEIRNVGLIDPNVQAPDGESIGSLIGILNGDMYSCYVEGGTISGFDSVGGLVGKAYGTVGDCYSTASVSGDFYVGGLFGYNGGTVQDCHSSASVTGRYSVGGLAGSTGGTIADCMSTASVSGGYEKTGGLAGGQSSGKIMRSYTSGIVEGEGKEVGGLLGHVGGTVSDCYSMAFVMGATEVGGLAGDASGIIQYCYSTGEVSGNSEEGGLLGANSGLVLHSFWDRDTSGQAGSAGGQGKSTADMQTESTFTDAGWDFLGESANGTEEIWAKPPEGGYPVFASTVVQTLTVQTEPDFIGTVDPSVGEHSVAGWVDLSAERYISCPHVYAFDRWIGDVEDANAASTRVFMDSDKTVTAVFVDDRKCGDECHPYPKGDVNEDCVFNFLDIAEIALDWLKCTKPECD